MVTGIILAGGKSSRMGFDKCFLKYYDITFIEKSIELIAGVSDKILLSTNKSEFKKFGYKTVSDKYTSIGPLGGIYSSLLISESDINVIIPCDLPKLSVDLLDFLLLKLDDYDAVVPIYNYKVEPLVGVYRRKILPDILFAINNKKYKILSLLQNINALFVPITKTLDFYSENLFNNINTLDDYNKFI